MYNVAIPNKFFTMPNQSLVSTNNTQGWYPDSGASHHVTNDIQNIQNIQKQNSFEGPNHIFVGNGQGLFINAKGSTHLLSPTSHDTKLVLNNLLYDPSITKNLVSVSEFARDNNVYFVFYPDSCFIKSQASHEVVLQGSVGANGLYKFTNLCLSTLAKSASPASAFSLDSFISATNVSNNVHANVLTVSDSSNPIPYNSTFSTWHRR